MYFFLLFYFDLHAESKHMFIHYILNKKYILCTDVCTNAHLSPYIVFQNSTTIETFPVDTLGPELPRLSIQQNVCVINQTGYVAGFHSEFKAPVWVHVTVDSQMVWNNVSTDLLKWRPMPGKTREFTLRHNVHVIWANQKTESFEYHWLRTLAMFDVTSFPAILSGIGRHFKRSQ